MAGGPRLPRVFATLATSGLSRHMWVPPGLSRMRPVSLPPTHSHTKRARTLAAVVSRIPPLPSLLGTVAVSESWGEAGGSGWGGLLVGTCWWCRGLLVGCHISAGLSLAQAPWGAGPPQIALKSA